METVTKPKGAGRQNKPGRDAEVVSITDAGAPHSDEIRSRMIKYATAMGIRMACLGLLFVLDGWFKLIAVAGAVFLPWIAVVIANGGDMAEAPSENLIGVPLQGELPAEAGEASDDGEGTGVDDSDDGVIQGEILSERDRRDGGDTA
ncbi:MULTISPECIES: DUF3099 domain-containing protein [Arthrobacter]|uniref:DUF3099 domain-containing protein n=2 Tax=Arthrobacter TaxID=1663 RepID=A0ABU9KHH3_9MICC|nr:DUF3099 domain-containing protein [Arthrobacter sp. YJM1]MDP5225813.1 DUF3099 domain-containing protein [Arthrobacter sp. YJM1]